MSHTSHSSHTSTTPHANVGTMPYGSVNELNGHYNSAYTYDGDADPMTLTWQYWVGDTINPKISDSRHQLEELYNNLSALDNNKGLSNTFVQVDTTTPVGSYFTYYSYDTSNKLGPTVNDIINTAGLKALNDHINAFSTAYLESIVGKGLALSDPEASDGFGRSVAISGDYAIVGAFNEDPDGISDAGSAYIFHRNIFNNTWGTGIKITASDKAAGAFFGYSVAISGDYAIVGAPYEDPGGATNAGSAYIFRRTGTNTWDAGVKIVASDKEANDYFGASVSIDGDYAIVGANLEDTGGYNAGAAYIFHRTGTNTWDTGTKIMASDKAADDQFGYSVTISGDYAIVGAPYEDPDGISDAGSAYIFHRTGTNTWDTGTKIVASGSLEADARFGNSVAISGDYAIMGAYSEDTGGYNAGAAYIFHRTGTNTWDTGTKIQSSDLENYDQFGYSVTISGDYAIVGAPYEDPDGISDAGSAYIFHRTGTNTWDTGTKIVASGSLEAGARFGNSVAISGDYAIMGAYLENLDGISNAGAAYVFGVSDWDTGTKITASDKAADDYFGRSVAISGDYAIMGAFGEDPDGITDAGSAYIFHRTGTNTWDAGFKITASDKGASDSFGYSVAISGDYAIVGAFVEDPDGITDAGAAYIFHRTGTNTWDAGFKITASDKAIGDNFGFSVAISGDYAIVGAYYEDPDGLNAAGAAYIFRRTGTNTWDTGFKITASDKAADDRFGYSVAISGDYAIVGANYEDPDGITDAGSAYIFHRTGTNTWDAGTKITASDKEANDYFGCSVAISGDYAIVGANYEDPGGVNAAGAAYIYHRTGTNTWDAGIKKTASDKAADDFFGRSVAIDGDYAIVGASYEDPGGLNAAGAAYIYYKIKDFTVEAGKVIASKFENIPLRSEGEIIRGEDIVKIKKTLNDFAQYDYSAQHGNHANHQNHASHTSYNG